MLDLKFLTNFFSLKIPNEVYLDNRMKFFIGWLSIFLLLIVLSGCSTNPATGEKIFTGLMTKEQEIHQGRKTHPKIVKLFGGQYGSTSLQNYIKSIGHRLTQTVERQNLIYNFTILDLKAVNAFALPGGYVYMTRALSPWLKMRLKLRAYYPMNWVTLMPFTMHRDMAKAYSQAS